MIETTTQVDPDKLMAIVLRAVEEAGAAPICTLFVIGDRLGYDRALVEHGASTPTELAEPTNTGEACSFRWQSAGLQM